MASENLKLVSCRIDPDALREIDDFVRDKHYWKRNSVINAIVTNVLKMMPKNELYDLVRYSKWDTNKWECHFKKVEEDREKQHG